MASTSSLSVSSVADIDAIWIAIFAHSSGVIVNLFMIGVFHYGQD